MTTLRKLGRSHRALALLLCALASGAAACRPDAATDTVGDPRTTARGNGGTVDAERARHLREAALASAKVWRAPSTPVAQANLAVNPPGTLAFGPGDDVSCRFKVKKVGGTTPKFYCELPDGQELKIKYGSANPELHAEVAASRLLTALGFPADRMYVVGRVRCAGCPDFPFQSLGCLERIDLPSICFPRGIDYDSVVDFDVAVVEQKLEGRVIEAFDDQGWAWFELDRIDAARGGSSRAEVDALRLMAVFLAHWDNKSANQRLVCEPGAEAGDGACARPLAIVQDLGATFGPTKIDLHNWRQGQVWTDGATCTASMKHLPWGGSTFPDARITDAGRRLLLGLLESLSDQQLRGLFEGSRVTQFDQVSAEARSADAWVKVFKDRVEQIRAAGPCPS